MDDISDLRRCYLDIKRQAIEIDRLNRELRTAREGMARPPGRYRDIDGAKGMIGLPTYSNGQMFQVLYGDPRPNEIFMRTFDKNNVQRLAQIAPATEWGAPCFTEGNE